MQLPVETGSWIKIDRNLRKCNLCNDNDVGDEFHFNYRCSFLMRSAKLPRLSLKNEKPPVSHSITFSTK